ncbi:MAG: 4-hydroxythreonine-4-phosphate dehydrogenase PdxA, partial [Pseudomonadota bacterium]
EKSAEINTIGHLWTTRVSSHIPIAEVPAHVTKSNVLGIVRYFDRELRRFGFAHPKIAVSGLNPHNGDGGMFGRQEIDEIGPAVDEAQKLQLNVSGPYPPDTIFLTVQEEKFLGVVSMYHDQCQIATKLLGFDEGVTYFGGLPFPITTPAHGTAYDIAGQGKARPTPMLNALKLSRRAVLTARGIAVEEETAL